MVAAVALGALAAPGHAAFRAGGTYGGGQLSEEPGRVPGPGTMLVSARPLDGRSFRIRANLRAACGGTTFERTVRLRDDGVWTLRARVVERSETGSVVASVRMTGKFVGDAGVGAAAVRLRVRTGKRIRRCVAPLEGFVIRRVSTGAAPARAPAEGGALYTGLTAQSVRNRSYPVVIRTSPEGRTLIGMAFSYFCTLPDGRVQESADFLNRGAISVDGAFTWVSRYTLRAGGGFRIKVSTRVTGRFRQGQATGTIQITGRLTTASGRLVGRCRPPEPIRFTAVL